MGMSLQSPSHRFSTATSARLRLVHSYANPSLTKD